MKYKSLFILCTLVVTLVGVPVLFNYVFLYESGHAKGEMSDWFTFYGNIFGGLIGGFFTYVALILTFKKQEEDMQPQIDIPHQSFEFVDDDTYTDLYTPIIIELNNIGGSIAKNIECKLSLSNYEEVFEYLKDKAEELEIEVKESNITIESEIVNQFDIDINKKGIYEGHLATIRKEYRSSFLGTCLPLTLNHEAKAKYIIHKQVRNWANYIGRNIPFDYDIKDVLFEFELEVKYVTIKGEEISDLFKLKWEDAGIGLEGTKIRYQYILRSKKIDKKKK
ncbi:hypothetical protein COO08_19475 [Bacillus toyonensis]|uniref:hypothetical protein n=1 Tax=Bacillus toyonensis TaxID=155322 RepID=UPI000BEC8EDF|nr:hypothetical protein [Bacillus toyonensis]PEB16989.1 hypothetical protein COO08_19475 [Bacillus toyonensis]